jgi:hypothetical protein
MPRWKKILFAFLCISTCCCFGGGFCCLCGFGCCCNFCCNHCCGKYQHDEDVFSSFQVSNSIIKHTKPSFFALQEDEDVPGLNTQRNNNGTSPTVVITSPQETDPVLGSTNEHIAIPMPPSYESTK